MNFPLFLTLKMAFGVVAGAVSERIMGAQN